MRIIKEDKSFDPETSLDITPDLREVYEGLDLAARLLANPNERRGDAGELVRGVRDDFAKILEVEP